MRRASSELKNPLSSATKAKAGIEKNPKSAFWHNQAGVAYDALGDFDIAVKEIKLATTLDSSDPSNYYTLYARCRLRWSKAVVQEL